ncbi:MAG: ThuA domain-containing protein [Candidatus Hydrogenedentes bacterium]|nr:ThuA domain-containing protein [Candidatus Hydrogenedentota bacterium]
MNTRNKLYGIIALLLFVALLPTTLMGQESVGLQAKIEGLPHLPDGHTLVAAVECGGSENFHADDGPRFALLEGESATISDGAGSLATVATSEKQVTYRLDGLDSDSEYVLGITWWDYDNKGRRQSLQIGTGDPLVWTTLLPAGRPLAFHGGKPTWARVFLPLKESLLASGELVVAVTKEAGPSAVVNTLCLLKKTDTKERKRVLIVTGDEYEGHAWRETAPEFAAILRGDHRLEVTITESPRTLASSVLNHYDAVFLNFKDYPEHLPSGEDEWTGVKRYIESGKGFVMAHFAIGAFEEWDEFVDLVGRVWNPEKRGHDPYGPFEVFVPKNTHPIVESMADFQTVGELYTCLDGTAKIDVLCEAQSKVDHVSYPMAFVVPGSKGRVFQCTMGHDVKALRSEGTRELYRRATAWAAGLPPSE